MTDNIDKTIEEIEGKLAAVLAEATELKKTVNQLLKLKGQPARYADPDAETSAGRMDIAPDEFYGRPLATAATEYLKRKGRAAPLAEIFGALKKGGYEFGDGDEKFQQRGLAISLRKNTQVFIYIKGSDSYGLREWYPDLAKQRRRKKGTRKTEQEELRPEKVEGQETETPKEQNEEENK